MTAADRFPSAIPRIAMASRLGRIVTCAKNSRCTASQMMYAAVRIKQARLQERRETLHFAVAVGMVGVGRTVGHSHREIGNDCGDEIQAGMQGLGEHPEASRRRG